MPCSAERAEHGGVRCCVSFRLRTAHPAVRIPTRKSVGLASGFFASLMLETFSNACTESVEDDITMENSCCGFIGILYGMPIESVCKQTRRLFPLCPLRPQPASGAGGSNCASKPACPQPPSHPPEPFTRPALSDWPRTAAPFHHFTSAATVSLPSFFIR